MLQIPKNVMQIGEINTHMKIYMEDYVHTFLERRKDAEEYLAFGRKEEHSDVTIYLIYGVEKKSDWNRGSFPYFKKYERIGTIEGAAGKRVFRPVRGAGILLNGYFVFYEQNEDMQSYMIVVREAEAAGGSEEKEQVLEAVRTRREKRLQENLENTDAPVYRRDENGSSMKPAAEAADNKKREKSAARLARKMQKKAGKNMVKAGMGQERDKTRQKISFARQPKQSRSWSIPDLCRAGSLVLVLVLVVLGITSVNRYPDMRAVTQMFSDAVRAVKGEKKDTVAVEAQLQEGELIVEETTEQIQWTIGQNALENESEESEPQVEETGAEEEAALEDGESPAWEEAEEQESAPGESSWPSEINAETENTESPEEETTQAISRPVSYVVKKGDNLAEIARRFYGNTSMIKEICTVNQIEDPDQIHPGQNILLP